MNANQVLIKINYREERFLYGEANLTIRTTRNKKVQRNTKSKERNVEGKVKENIKESLSKYK